MTINDQRPAVVAQPLQAWLLDAVQQDASDLHILAGYPPVIRLHGRLQEAAAETLSAEQTHDLLVALMPVAARERFFRDRNVDFAFELEHHGGSRRFRANCFFADEQVGGCFRVIPDQIPDFDWAGFPRDLAERLADFRNGLVIFCGVTGAGKTTTLAMIIDLLCRRANHRVVTIEEPIEYRFPKTTGSVVSQREVGRDVPSFDEGLKHSLRQDPDVILVGEIRDRDTAQTALRAAETGHLVFTTLHTQDAKGAISRYTDLFPRETQHEVRGQLAASLRAVVSQHLLPGSLPEDKRVLALEVMLNTSPISIAIRLGKPETIDNTIQTSRSEGMMPLNESVKRQLHAGAISRQTAERFVTDRDYLR